MAIEIRTTVCEIFLSGRRSSLIIWRTQNCLHPVHSSQDTDSESPTKVVSKSRKHGIYAHFPKDRNCEVCLRTKMTRAPCRRRTGEALPWAERFGDLIKADRKVLNEEGESRDNHRYAAMVQDLATQWNSILIRVKQRHHMRSEKSLRKVLGAVTHSQKSFHTDNSLEFGKIL